MNEPTPIPLVAPDREAVIREFYSRLLELQRMFGLTIKVDPEDPLSRDIVITDHRRAGKLPADYKFDAFITREGKLEIADWITNPAPTSTYDELIKLETFIMDELAAREQSMLPTEPDSPHAEYILSARSALVRVHVLMGIWMRDQDWKAAEKALSQMHDFERPHYIPWQLAPDEEAYGDKAGWWIVVSRDYEEERSSPVPTLEECMKLIEELEIAAAERSME